MISKVITGRSFYGVCSYICRNQRRAVILEADGVRGHNYKLMASDFETQHALRPGLRKAVFHGILSFYPREEIGDQKMASIAKEYLEKIGIINTQYAIVKHIDRDHPHLHVIANLVNNNGETIKDNWIGLRGKKIAQQLTLKHDLKQAISKTLSLTHLERLSEKEVHRYTIYQAISERLANCRNLEELENSLWKQGITIKYKYKSGTDELQGISFNLWQYKFKGSEIDRRFSLKNLQRAIDENNRLQLSPSLRINSSEVTAMQSREKPMKEDQQEKLSVLQELIKPETNNEQTPYQLKRKQKKKKRGLRMN